MTILGVSTVSRNPAVAGDGLMMPAAAAAAAPYGAAGPLISGTSLTTNAIDTAINKTFVIEEYGRSFYPGTRLRATATGFSDVWLEGIVTAWDGESVTIDGDKSSGTGNYSNWKINVAGEPGVQGPIGPQGAIGPSGGPAGPQGVPGTPGSVWRNGNGVPLNSLGANGDYYLNDLNGDVYIRTASVYSIVANIEGADGAAGAAGAPGPQGPTGPQGIIPEPPNDSNIYGRRVSSGIGSWQLPPGGGDVQSSRTLSAGSGLTGGGTLAADRIFNVGAGAGITVNADDVALTIPVAVTSGGTGAITAAAALTSLGAAPIASPTFTGDPKAPTPTAGDNDTSIATTAFVTAALSSASGGTDSRLQNLGLAVSAAAGALTIALKGANGSDPSASNPVVIDFRNASLLTGTPTTVTVQAATSLVLASGNTMAAISATAFRLWIVAFNNAGVVELGAIHCSATPTRIYPIEESKLQSSSAASGNVATEGAFATTTARSNLPIRILGYIEWGPGGLATAGTWTTTNLQAIQIFGPGIRKPGDPIQRMIGILVGSSSTSSTSFVPTTLQVTIVPTNAVNPIVVDAAFIMQSVSSNGDANARMSRGITANTGMFGSNAECWASSSPPATTGTCMGTDRPNTTSSTTYCVQLRANSITVQIAGGGQESHMIATEIMG